MYRLSALSSVLYLYIIVLLWYLFHIRYNPVSSYNHEYEQLCQEKLKKLKAKYKKFSDKKKEKGLRRYPEWDYYDAMSSGLWHMPSTWPAVVFDALEVTQVQSYDMQIDDEQLEETEVGVASSLDTSDTAVSSTDVTDSSDKMATISQGQKKGI